MSKYVLYVSGGEILARARNKTQAEIKAKKLAKKMGKKIHLAETKKSYR